MTTVLGWIRSVGTGIATAAARVVHAVQQLGQWVSYRLVERWHTDGTYRRTLIAAASALTATVLPHPAAAAAVGALLADHGTYTADRRHTFTGDYDYGYEDDDHVPGWGSPPHRWGTSRL